MLAALPSSIPALPQNHQELKQHGSARVGAPLGADVAS